MLDDVASRLGSLWDEVTPEDRNRLEEIQERFAFILGKSITKGERYFKREQAHLNAQFLNMGARYANELEKAFWDAAGAFVGGLIKAAL